MRVPHVMLTCVQNPDDVMNRRLAKEMSPWKVPNILRMLSGAPSDHVTFVRNVGTMYVEFFLLEKTKAHRRLRMCLRVDTGVGVGVGVGRTREQENTRTPPSMRSRVACVFMLFDKRVCAHNMLTSFIDYI